MCTKMLYFVLSTKPNSTNAITDDASNAYADAMPVIPIMCRFVCPKMLAVLLPAKPNSTDDATNDADGANANAIHVSSNAIVFRFVRS